MSRVNASPPVPRRPPQPSALLAAAVLCASACSGGLSVGISSPEDGGKTHAATLTVSGTASAGDKQVRSVSVNGAPATTADNFASWTATVPIAIGDNVIVATATDENGHTATASVTVNKPVLEISAPKTVDLVSPMGETPRSQDLVLTFTGPSVYQSALSDYADWLTITPPVSSRVSPATFKLTPRYALFQVGTTLSANLAFASSRDDGQGGTEIVTAWVHVTYSVVEPFDATAPAMSFSAIRADPRGPQPSAGYAVGIRGGLAHWHLGGPPWARFSQASGTGPASVTVTADTAGQAMGTYPSQVTVTDDDSGHSRSFPVSLDYRAARLAPASASITVDALTAAANLSRPLSISDDLGGTQPSESVTWTVQATSAPWLHVTPSSGGTAPATAVTVSVDASALETLPAGQTTATITLAWQNAQLSGQSMAIPVTVDNQLPYVDVAAPYTGIAGRAGTLIARGHSFAPAGGPLTAFVGTTDLPGLVPDNATQLTIGYPALPAGRYPVGIRNALGISRTNAELVVLAPPAFSYQAIAAPTPRRRIIWDDERQTLLGLNTAGEQIERYHFSSGSWSAAPPFALQGLRDAALATSGRSLVVVSKRSVSEIQLASEPWVAAPRASNPDPATNLDQIALANSGIALVTRRDPVYSGQAELSYLYDSASHSLVEAPDPQGWFTAGAAMASADGSWIYAGSTGFSTFLSAFDSKAGTLDLVSYGFDMAGATVNGDASRVIFQGYGRGTKVYDHSLTYLGDLANIGWTEVVLAARGSNKVFAYADYSVYSMPQIFVYDVSGPPGPNGKYPVSKTITLPDRPTANPAALSAISLAVTRDDSTLFVSGDTGILVVPVN